LALPDQPALQTVMPNRKQLGDCARKELLEISKRLKGWSECLSRRARKLNKRSCLPVSRRERGLGCSAVRSIVRKPASIAAAW